MMNQKAFLAPSKLAPQEAWVLCIYLFIFSRISMNLCVLIYC
jgi:hypothetical protein